MKADDADGEDEDVKVFTGSRKASANIVEEAEVLPAEEEISAAPTKSAKKSSSDYNLDDWDDLVAFLNADLDIEESEEPRSEKRAKNKDRRSK